ncbi:hypothetical protein [Guptibacillus hwajinpoensis]|uniref:Uncharacterized protein n=1 Tax=Guptibacillus hwajinpoensis TaxID=208199 RepID=A0ABU0K7B0_9BACL|nr:hypothetical protein [Alkalihalobacillus hemicentroti]MDQ0484002.1 hypothetical protein [Alkalihalobacillus hemicentroti]
MGTFLVITGMLGFIVMMIILVIGAFKRKGKAKKHSLLMGLFFVILVIGVSMLPATEQTGGADSSEETKSADTKNEESVKENDKQAEETEAKKQAEEEAAKKAEEEAKAKKQAEEEAAKKAEEEAKAKKQAEEEAAKKAEEEAKAKKQAEEEAAKKAKEEAEAKKQAEEEKKNAIPGTLGMTANEFKSEWNGAVNSLDISDSMFQIDNLEVSNGDVQGSFQKMLNQNIAVIGTINKADDSVRDVMILAQGDGTPSSGANMMISFGLLINATNPSLSADQRGQVFHDLGILDEGADLLSLNNSVVTNGVEYSFDGTAADSFGVTFSAGDPDDN